MTQGLLTTGEISRFCSVTDRAVLKWVAKGKIEAYRTPGRHSRIRVDDLISFMVECGMPIPEELMERAERLRRLPRVLIVEDDRMISKTIRKILEKDEMYEVEIAYNGFSAGMMINDFKPDLITLDILMPMVDGFEVCRRLRDNAAHDDIKVIVVSGVEDNRAKKKILDLGANDYMLKPISSAKLLEKVGNLIGTKKI